MSHVRQLIESMNTQVLMIEDDERLAKMVGDYLRQSGFGFSHAADGARGLSEVQKNAPHLVILDLMLPDMDGLQVCQKIRIVGLELGADDYLPKPFEPRELLARIRAVLRRQSDSGSGKNTRLQFGSLEIDRDARTVSVKGQVCELTSYQFDLLVAMAERAGRVLSRDQIMEAVRGRELEAFDRSIDVHMGRIRMAIEDDPKMPERILTVRGVGYVFTKQQK